MLEVVGAPSFGELFECAADAVLQTIDGAFGGASYQRFQLGKCIFRRKRDGASTWRFDLRIFRDDVITGILKVSVRRWVLIGLS
jgi:hypothetical protein